MKSYKLILLILTLVNLTSVFGQQKEVIIPFTDAQGEKHLNVQIFSGNISIQGTNRTDVKVTYSIMESEDNDHEPAPKKSHGMKKISGGNFGLEITESDNIIEIESQNFANLLALNIEVPTNITLDISKNIGEKIEIKGVNGKINVENNVGSITVYGAKGIVNASNTAGNIKVVFDIIPDPKNMSFNSMTGDIDITLPADYKCDLKMKTDWGDIYSDHEIITKAVQPEEKITEENGKFKFYTDSWTHATLNGGGNELTLKTQMGSIYLRKK